MHKYATRVKKRRGALIFQRRCESHAADLITIGAERMKDAAPQPKHIRHNEVREEMCHRRITLSTARRLSRDKLLFLNIFLFCVTVVLRYTVRRFFND
jgi:hypothetical protein